MEPEKKESSIDLKEEDIKRLHNALERLGYEIPSDEKKKNNYGQGTKKAILDFQEKNGLEATGTVDAATIKALGIAAAEKDANLYSVEGMVTSRYRAGVGKLQVAIVDKNVGRDVVLANAVTDSSGRFTAELQFDPIGKKLNLIFRRGCSQKRPSLGHLMSATMLQTVKPLSGKVLTVKFTCKEDRKT